MKVNNKKLFQGMFLATIVALFASFLITPTAQAATGVNQQISFQGKLVNTNGTNIADGTYNLRFKIYQDGTGCVSGGTTPCGGTLKWTESRLVNATQGVVVTAGTFQVNLGSVTAFGSSVDWNQDTLWMSMDVGGTANTAVWDGEMTPFIRMTAVPYAMNALKVGGLTSSQLVQLSPGTQQTGFIDVNGNITTGSNVIASGSVMTTSVQAPPLSSLLLAGDLGITLGSHVTLPTGATLTAGDEILVIDANGLITGDAVSGAYAGINGVGTITSGTWNATSVGAAYGGTGLSSYTIGDLLYASGTTTLGKLAAVTAGSCLKSNGTGAAPVWGSCAAGSSPTLQASYDGGNSINQTAAGTITFTSSTTVPTADQFVIDNTGSTGVTTADVNAANIKYKGGAAAVNGSGLRIDYQPGGTTGGTWSGLEIVANATGAATGVNSYGLKLVGPTTPGAGTDTGMYIGSGWDIGVNIASGGIQLASMADPTTAPATDNLQIYAKTIAGRVVPKWMGAAGVDTPFQANFGFNRIAMLSPSGISAGGSSANIYNSWGVTTTSAGAFFTSPVLASTNLNTSIRKSRITSGATAGLLASTYSSLGMAWRGNANGLGGYYFTTRFSLSTLQTGNRAFFGLSDLNAVPTNIDPTTSTTYAKLGVAINASTGNLKWVNNATGTAPTSSGVDLGANFPVNTTNLYELIIFSAPFNSATNNGNSITYRVKNLSTGSVTADTTVTTNLPANTSFMSPSLWITNNATAAAVSFDTAGWYLESDN